MVRSSHIALAFAILTSSLAWASPGDEVLPPPPTYKANGVTVDEQIGAKLPLEAAFRTSDGTRVTLEHRGFAALRDDHPVRHGKPAVEFIRDMGLWWGSLMTSLREHAERG